MLRAEVYAHAMRASQNRKSISPPIESEMNAMAICPVVLNLNKKK